MITFIKKQLQSCKSFLVQKLALQNSGSLFYFFPSKILNDSSSQRITQYKNYRDKGWAPIEEQKEINSPNIACKTTVVDFIIFLLKHFFVEFEWNIHARQDYAVEQSRQIFLKEMQ